MDLASSPGLLSPRPRGTAAQALRPFLVFTAAALLLLQVSRLALVGWQHDRVLAAGHLGYVFLQGLRFDLAGIGYALVLPALLAPLLLATRWTYRPGSLLVRGVLAGMLVLFLVLELATPSFLGEYDARPNYLFVEYLRYPREVLGTLWGAYPWQLVLACLAVPLAGLGAWKLLAAARVPAAPLPLYKAVLLGPGLAVLCGLAARSSLGHRPANQSTIAYSSDAMVNTLPMPSFYTLLLAIHDMRRHERGKIAYGSLPYDEVLELVRADTGLPPEAFGDPAIPTLHVQRPTQPRDRPLNLVIVLEESLGAEFVGCMGGLPLTPELDALSGEGLWLERLYATGTRSVRGIEAVVTSFLPTPAAAVVKLPRSERGFFTVAELLRRHGYATSFMYGGDANFDNMRRFFAGNGFETIIERRDFEDPAFVGSWGASDEDLFRRAHEEFLAQGEEPFFSLVFSSSNHSPWEFPDGAIELYEEPAATRNNAVKYADHALGELFDLARGSPYWDDTVFLVVADHNSRVYGSSLVPVERFHVPALFLGGTIAPERVSTLASQVDLVPTALSLIGIETRHPSLGRDLTDPVQRARPGRAILQYYDSNLFLAEDRAVVLRPDLPAAFFTWDGASLSPAPEDPQLERRALAHALWPQLAYRALDYRLPDETILADQRGPSR